MKNLIRYGELIDNTTRRFVPPEDDATALPPDEPGWEVPLATWLAGRDTLRARQHPVAVLLGPADDAADLAQDGKGRIDPTGITYIAIEFPAYTDGRGYSIAQRLRSHYGWEGELRAVGDILIDTIHYQARCGFDSFVVKEGHDPRKALEALSTFTVHYQREYPRPLAA